MKRWMVLFLVIFMCLSTGCSNSKKTYEDEIKELGFNYKKDMLTITKDDKEMELVNKLIESDESSKEDAYKEMDEYIKDKYNKYFSKEAYDKFFAKVAPNNIYRMYAQNTESTIEFKDIEFTNISEPKDDFVSVSCKVTFDILDKNGGKEAITENSEMVFINEGGKWKINSDTIFFKEFMDNKPF